MLLKTVTTSLLALIPKIVIPITFDDYRLSCLISSMYRILAKLLAPRLKLVIGKLIYSFQSTFIPNRNMLDEVIVLNEMLDYAKRYKKTHDG